MQRSIEGGFFEFLSSLYINKIQENYSYINWLQDNGYGKNK